MPSGMQEVLDMMTTGISERKKAKAATLTPVGTEKGGPLDGEHRVAFPYDGADVIQQAIKQGLEEVGKAKYHLDFVGQGLLELAKLYGLPETRTAPADEAKSAEAEQKQREHEADQRHFERQLAEKAAAAQAAVFADVPAEERPGTTAPVTKWVCPTHGADKVKVLTSRKGRVYGACEVSGCSEFER